MRILWSFSWEKAPSAPTGTWQDGTGGSASQGRVMEMGKKTGFKTLV